MVDLPTDVLPMNATTVGVVVLDELAAAALGVAEPDEAVVYQQLRALLLLPDAEPSRLHVAHVECLHLGRVTLGMDDGIHEKGRERVDHLVVPLAVKRPHGDVFSPARLVLCAGRGQAALHRARDAVEVGGRTSHAFSAVRSVEEEQLPPAESAEQAP